MSNLWDLAYPQIANDINNIIEDPPHDMTHIDLAMKTIVDIHDNSEEARLIETTMLPLLYRLYLQIYVHWSYTIHLKYAIQKINDFTIQYYGDLTTYVNSLSWDDGCIPYYWTQYSEELGYDTSEWISCSS
jgi:hypothetical protein